MDDNAAMIGDWLPPSPNPKGYFSSLFGGDEEVSSGPVPQTPSEAINDSSSFGSDQSSGYEDSNAKQGGISFDNVMILNSLPVNIPSSCGGLADRLAARAGFTAPRLNTESVRLTDPASSVNGVNSTIQTAISPTALLESPIFLSNPLTLASPTTGKFSLFPDENDKSITTAKAYQSFKWFFYRSF